MPDRSRSRADRAGRTRAVLEEACRAESAIDDALRARLYAPARRRSHRGERGRAGAARLRPVRRGGRRGAPRRRSGALAIALMGTYYAAAVGMRRPHPAGTVPSTQEILEAAEAGGEHEYAAAIRYCARHDLVRDRRARAPSRPRSTASPRRRRRRAFPRRSGWRTAWRRCAPPCRGGSPKRGDAMERALATGRRVQLPNAVGVHASQRIMWHAFQGRLAEIGPEIDAFVDAHPGGAGWRPFRALARLGRGDAVAARAEFQTLLATGLAPAERGVMARMLPRGSRRALRRAARSRARAGALRPRRAPARRRGASTAARRWDRGRSCSARSPACAGGRRMRSGTSRPRSGSAGAWGRRPSSRGRRACSRACACRCSRGTDERDAHRGAAGRGGAVCQGARAGRRHGARRARAGAARREHRRARPQRVPLRRGRVDGALRRRRTASEGRQGAALPGDVARSARTRGARAGARWRATRAPPTGAHDGLSIGLPGGSLDDAPDERARRAVPRAARRAARRSSTRPSSSPTAAAPSGCARELDQLVAQLAGRFGATRRTPRPRGDGAQGGDQGAPHADRQAPRRAPRARPASARQRFAWDGLRLCAADADRLGRRVRTGLAARPYDLAAAQKATCSGEWK